MYFSRQQRIAAAVMTAAGLVFQPVASAAHDTRPATVARAIKKTETQAERDQARALADARQKADRDWRAYLNIIKGMVKKDRKNDNKDINDQIAEIIKKSNYKQKPYEFFNPSSEYQYIYEITKRGIYSIMYKDTRYETKVFLSHIPVLKYHDTHAYPPFTRDEGKRTATYGLDITYEIQDIKGVTIIFNAEVVSAQLSQQYGITIGKTKHMEDSVELLAYKCHNWTVVEYVEWQYGYVQEVVDGARKLTPVRIAKGYHPQAISHCQ